MRTAVGTITMKVCAGGCRVALWVGLVCSNAAFSGETFMVTRTDDPPPNGCQVGDCSVREAILAANSASGPDNVVLAAETYVIGSTIEVTGELRMWGVDTNQTHLVAALELDALLQLDDDAPTTLALRDLSIDALGGNEVDGDAGASLVLDHVHAPNSEGGIFLDFGTGGVVNVFDTVIAGYFGFYGTSFASIDDSRFGRLALLQTDANAGHQLSLFRVVVDGSSTAGSSALRLDSVGEVRMLDVTVQDTRLGFYIERVPEILTIDGLRYLRNQRPMVVSSGADFTIARSEFRDNRPAESNEPEEPAALWIDHPGAHVVVVDSTFAGNTGTSDTGGAVLVEGGAELSLRNSTFVNNSFTVGAASGGARGGAIGYRSDPADTVLTLQNVTIVASAIGAVGAEGSALGGRGLGADVLLNVYNSVFAGTCRSDGAVPDFAIGNVKTAGDSCGFGNGNLLGVSRADLALGPLGDHGGMTATVIPGPGSVVIDAGNNFGCLDTDQRGIERPSGLRCDAGAIETGDVIFANGFN